MMWLFGNGNSWHGGLDERKRILEGKTDYLSAMIENFEEAFFSASTQHGKKRKRDDDDLLSSISAWITTGQELVQQARSFLGQVGEVYSEKKGTLGVGSILHFQTHVNILDVNKLIRALSDHEKEVDDMFLGRNLFSQHAGPARGTLIPVRGLFGQGSSDALQKLQRLLQSAEVRSVAICGIEGIGKTFSMKHLHNSALNWADRFDYVFWVTFPRQFSIERVQDAIAAAVKCHLPSDEDLNVRAGKLSDIFVGLGRSVLFLDNVPEAKFSLAQIGIPYSIKLVLTTRSTVVSTMLNCSETVNLDRLSEEDACQFFMNEAGISSRNALLLKNIPQSLAQKCHGVPRMIVDIATRMCGIDDIREWKNALFEFR